MAKDLIHDSVKIALQKDNWYVSDDPFIVETGGTKFNVDLGAEKVIVAEKGATKIAVEVKSFTKIALVYDFYEAFGQYMFYREAFSDEKIDRTLYLAISLATWKRIENIPFLLKRIQQFQLKIIVVDIYKQIILEWIE